MVTTTTDSQGRTVIVRLLEVVRYRGVVLSLVRRDVKRRYKGSILGFLWHLVYPLLIMGILWYVFSAIFEKMGTIEGYAVYLLSALIAWNLFSQSVIGGTTNLVTSGGLIRKVYVPKAVFPLASVGGSLVNFVLSLIPLFLLNLIDGRPIGWAVLFLPVGLLLLLGFSTGMGLLVSSLNVFYRDIQHITEVVFLAWFYATPIIWHVTFAPELETLSRWNPMALLIECLRAPIYQGTLPHFRTVALAAVSAIAVLALGAFVFARLERRFIYHL